MVLVFAQLVDRGARVGDYLGPVLLALVDAADPLDRLVIGERASARAWWNSCSLSGLPLGPTGGAAIVVTRRGAGPRHAAFHPTAPYAYVLNELDSTLTTYRFDPEGGGLVPLQVITTLPPAFTGDNTTSEIAVAPSGRFVYASNRGHDNIVIFRVDEAAGVLEPVGWEPTQGRTPRFFTLDPAGAFLYAANQDSDTIVAFRVDPQAGTLTPTGQVVSVGSPSSIVFR